jgi:hypothetical protein
MLRVPLLSLLKVAMSLPALLVCCTKDGSLTQPKQRHRLARHEEAEDHPPITQLHRFRVFVKGKLRSLGVFD